MIHPDSILRYHRVMQDYNCGYAVPSSLVMVISPEGKSYISPDDEDDATFLDRIERSCKIKRNLFYEEWSENKSTPGEWI